MAIQFKDKKLEILLEAKASTELSASQVACRDLWRYEWLLANEETLMLTESEFYALATTVKAMPHLLEATQIKRFPLLVEDSMKSCRHDLTGRPSKEVIWNGFYVDELIRKLNKASPIQLFAILERVEKTSKDELEKALLAQKRN